MARQTIGGRREHRFARPPARGVPPQLPDDVLGLILNNKKDPERGGDPKYLFSKTETVAGPFGSLPWAEIGHGSVEPERNGDPPRQGLCLGAILPKNGYVVEAVASPPLEEKAAAPLVEFLKKGIVYKGPVVNPNWTDEEAHQRWQHDAPADAKEKLEPIIRTKHYIIFTNSAGGQAFAKKMEECYDAIKKTYPFDDSAFPRLLPVFLFRTPEQYYEYYSKLAGISREQAAKSKGHAWRDYYATWYESPGIPSTSTRRRTRSSRTACASAAAAPGSRKGWPSTCRPNPTIATTRRARSRKRST